jgi:hypothetical protein
MPVSERDSSWLVGAGEMLVGIGLMIAGYSKLRGAGAPAMFGTFAANESLTDASKRTTGAVRARLVNAPTIEARLAIIRRLAIQDSIKPQMKEIAAAILSRKCDGQLCTPAKDWRGEIRAVMRAMIDPSSPYYVRYMRDHLTVDQYTAPLKTLTKLHAGDCDDMAAAGASILRAAGYQVRMRIIQAQGAPSWSHIYLMVGVPPGNATQWIPFDATMPEKGFGWEAPDSMLERDARGQPMRKDFKV